MDVKDSPTIHAGFDISQRVCLVTGGTSGIGRTIALGFADAGASVVAASSDGDKVAAMRDELREHGRRHDALQMDVASEDSVWFTRTENVATIANHPNSS